MSAEGVRRGGAPLISQAKGQSSGATQSRQMQMFYSLES